MSITDDDRAMIHEALTGYAKELHRLAEAQWSLQTEKFMAAARETRQRARAFLDLADEFQQKQP